MILENDQEFLENRPMIFQNLLIILENSRMFLGNSRRIFEYYTVFWTDCLIKGFSVLKTGKIYSLKNLMMVKWSTASP